MISSFAFVAIGAADHNSAVDCDKVSSNLSLPISKLLLFKCFNATLLELRSSALQFAKVIMFFITPQREHLVQFSETEPKQGPSKKRKQQLLYQHHQPAPQAIEEVIGGYYPRRVSKACDRCRVKKVKCSGGKLCKRCELDGVVCITTSMSARNEAPVEARQYHLVESQRDRLLQILSEILHGKDESEVARLRGMLSDMGLSAKSLSSSLATINDDTQSVVVDSLAFEQDPEPFLVGLFNQPEDKESHELWYNFDEMHPTRLAGGSPDTTVPFDVRALPPTNTFDFDDMVDWNSTHTLM